MVIEQVLVAVIVEYVCCSGCKGFKISMRRLITERVVVARVVK